MAIWTGVTSQFSLTPPPPPPPPPLFLAKIHHQARSLFFFPLLFPEQEKKTWKLSRPSGTLWNSCCGCSGAHFSCNIAKAINHQFSTQIWSHSHKKRQKKKEKSDPSTLLLLFLLRRPPPPGIPIAVVSAKRPGRSPNSPLLLLPLTLGLLILLFLFIYIYIYINIYFMFNFFFLSHLI